MKKKLHWTQTPAGRKIMSDTAKRRGKKNEQGNQEVFAFGYVIGWLEAYARSTKVSVHSLTERVGELLRESTVR